MRYITYDIYLYLYTYGFSLMYSHNQRTMRTCLSFIGHSTCLAFSRTAHPCLSVCGACFRSAAGFNRHMEGWLTDFFLETFKAQ